MASQLTNGRREGDSFGSRLQRNVKKFMAFRLETEEYGVPIRKVREIIRPLPITRVPNTRPWVRGVINLRGKVIPVMDLRSLLGMSPLAESELTVIIVLQYEHGEQVRTAGVIVDEVLEVIALSEKQIDPALDLGMEATLTRALLGIGKLDDRIVFLLDVARTLESDGAGAEEIEAARRAAEMRIEAESEEAR